MSVPQAQKVILADRRQKVADFLLAHLPQVEIAERLGVSDSTISRDVAKILSCWNQEIADKAAHIRAREVFDLDLMERHVITQEMNALRLRDKQPLDSRHWERYDHSARAWSQQRLEIKQRRAKLLNLDLQTPTTDNRQQVNITFIDLKRPDEVPQIGSGEVVEGEVIDTIPEDHLELIG